MNNRKSSLDAATKNNFKESVYVHVHAYLAHHLLLAGDENRKATHPHSGHVDGSMRGCLSAGRYFRAATLLPSGDE
jgi:hypothetical protein